MDKQTQTYRQAVKRESEDRQQRGRDGQTDILRRLKR